MYDFFENRPSFKNLIGKYDLVGAEIGVLYGENAFHIMTSLSIKKLYLIDPWLGYAGLNGHGVVGNTKEAEKMLFHTEMIMAEFGDKVEILRFLAEDAVHMIPNDLDFIYIDGNHRYPWVIKDIKNYAPKVKLGGQVAGHDFKNGEQGVRKAVEEYFNSNYNHKRWDWWHIKGEIDEKKSKQTITRFINKKKGFSWS